MSINESVKAGQDLLKKLKPLFEEARECCKRLKTRVGELKEATDLLCASMENLCDLFKDIPE